MEIHSLRHPLTQSTVKKQNTLISPLSLNNNQKSQMAMHSSLLTYRSDTAGHLLLQGEKLR